jgi:hypothetical protein
MPESRYAKYFITKTPPNPNHPQNMDRDSDVPWWCSLFISEELGGAVPDAFYLETGMVLRTGTIELLRESHSHPFDEYLLFHRTDPEDQLDLGGEVEFWMGDEKHVITKTCAVFVPKGMPHCPLVFTRVDRPFVFITTGNTLGYQYEDDPREKLDKTEV